MGNKQIQTKKAFSSQHNSPVRGFISSEKFIEKFENRGLNTFRLLSDPEEREYFPKCIYCSKENLDMGINTKIKCKECKTIYELEPVSEKKQRKSSMFNKITNKIKSSFVNKDNISTLKQLKNLVLFVDRDSLLKNFQSESIVDYNLIITQLLLPFFKMKSRIVKIGLNFKIGDVNFRVEGVHPGSKGIVTSKTLIQCNNFFTKKNEIERVLLLLDEANDLFNQEIETQKILKIHEENSNPIYIVKDSILEINDKIFYVRNSQPTSGVLSSNTIISVENKKISPLFKINIAIVGDCEGSEKDKNLFEKHIYNEFYKPFFLSGVKKYLERGDIFFIEKIEVLILNCIPQSGYVLPETSVGFTLGLTKDQCLERLTEIDNLVAKEIFINEDFESSFKDRGSRNSYDSQEFPQDKKEKRKSSFFKEFFKFLSEGPKDSYQNQNEAIQENLDMLRNEIIKDNINQAVYQENMNRLILTSLPTLKLDQNYIDLIKNSNEEEGYKRCNICLSEFEVLNEIKTLPCFHYFHNECISEWLKEQTNCPLCLHDVKQII